MITRNHNSKGAVIHDFLKRRAISVGAMYLRHSPWLRGRYRIGSTLLPWLRRLGPSMGKRMVQTRYHFRFHADLADWLGQYVYLTGGYEPPTAALFADLVKPGNTVLDVGANAGFFSLLCAVLTGASGRVIAFEPIPVVRTSLAANIALNDFHQIEVIPKAVSDVAATLTIYEGPEGHKGISSLRPLESASNKLTIEAIALDDIASEIGKVNCVKIDVEGAEMRALMGMEKLVERDRPYFIIEFTDAYLKGFGHTVYQMARWLRVRGYQLYRIEEQGLILLNLSAPGLPDQYNVLACQTLPARLVPRVLHQ